MLSLNRSRVPICLLFLLLLIAAGVQHRLADLDFEWDSEVLLENNETVDGEEVASMLIVVDDFARPLTPTLVEPVGEMPAPLLPAPRSLLLVDPTDPRAPPAREFADTLD